MSTEAQDRKPRRVRLWQVLVAITALLAVLIVPPMVSVSRYKSSITRLLSTSLGRPVRLSSVEVRLLPRPGFVLTDLTVDEDPAYGVEPILHANTVTASIRLLSLWRGRLEIGRISVDEASLNLVRNSSGHWNLDSLFRSSGVRDNARARRPLPYLVATNSRINVKNGLEKLPFSLTDADLSFWQQNPGDWRIRLKAQPNRTDLNLQAGDTGTLRLEGSLRDAPVLRQMPLHLDVEWRDAQLGQLSRLLVGTDPGWRGDLRGEFHLDGTAESAQVITRLRAQGVHRAEFAPAQPMDFDARCNYTWHQMTRSVEKLACDSPLGNGRIRVTGDLPSEAQPALTFELDRVPMTAGLDALRTVRSDFAPGIEAKGAISGKLIYAPVAAAPQPVVPVKRGKAAPVATPAGPLTGSLTVDGFELNGGGLSSPLVFPQLTFTPANGEEALSTSTSLPAGGSAPLAITLRASRSGYELGFHGQASVVRARELTHVANGSKLLDAFAGDPLAIDLTLQGPWRPAETAALKAPVASDVVNGTITLHNANWKAPYLENALLIQQGTLHLTNNSADFGPVSFGYGPVKGTASFTIPSGCSGANCTPHFDVQFAQLDISTLQAAILGAQEKVTLISTLLARLHPAAAPAWPHMEGSIKADTLTLGHLTLRTATAQVRITETGVQISSLDAGLLGGHLHGSGLLTPPASEKEKPAYSFEASFDKLNPAQVGLLLDQHWSGGTMNGSGKATLGGFTEADLAASAKGSLHFDWQKGAVGSASADLARFDQWSADAEIAGGAIHLTKNEIRHGSKTASAEGSATLGAGAKVSFTKDTAKQ